MTKSCHVVLLSLLFIINITDWIVHVTCTDTRQLMTNRPRYNRFTKNRQQTSNSLEVSQPYLQDLIRDNSLLRQPQSSPRQLSSILSNLSTRSGDPDQKKQQQLMKHITQRLYQILRKNRQDKSDTKLSKRTDQEPNIPEQIGMRRRKGPDFNPTGW